MNEKFHIERDWMYKGHRCIVGYVKKAGHRCGYIAIDQYHFMYLDDGDAINLDVHGGVTWNERFLPWEDDEGLTRWVGFDCAHSMDSPDPDLVEAPYDRLLHFRNGDIRTEAYCVEQCECMIDQIVEVYGMPTNPNLLNDDLFTIETP